MIQLKDINRQLNVDRPIRISAKNEVDNNWQVLRMQGFIRDSKLDIELADLSWVNNCWKDQPCYVIGASPALKNMIEEGFNFNMLKGKHTIACNHVIEDFEPEWFLFLDQEFLEKTKYDLKKYKGKLFVRNTCNIFKSDLPYKFFRFMTRNTNGCVDYQLNNGIYNNTQSGLCCLHLAVVSGANPIYLIGLDTGGGGVYYKKDYSGIRSTVHTIYKNPIKRNKIYEPFSKWKDRIVNLDTKGVLKWFIKEDWKEIFQIPEKEKIEIKQEPIICHVSRFRDRSILNEVSRQVMGTIGKHITSHIMDEKQPKADIYILDCIINSHNAFINFQKPKGSKVISIVHSTTPCFPALSSDKIVVLSKMEQERMTKYGFKSILIPCAIDLKFYNNEIDYTKKTYGRILRYTSGKMNIRFFPIVNEIKSKYPDSECILITKPQLKYPNVEYIENIGNGDNIEKAKQLQRITMFTQYHAGYIETFSISLLEAMGAGLCIVMYCPTPQPAMMEVLGNTGIICNNEEEFKNTIIKYLPDAQYKKEWGLKARERAKIFSVEKMIEKYNEIIKELL